MSERDNDYCTWTCTGTVASVSNRSSTYGSEYKLLTVQTNMGEVNLYVMNVMLFDTVDSLTPGQRITAYGFLGEEYQSKGGNSPYFLRPSEIDT